MLRFFSLLVFLIISLSGCSPIEFTKTIWGSSTRALESARGEAIVRTYDKSYWDVLRTSLLVVDKQKWIIFKKDEVHGYMVLMGIRGAVNTTEVGVFFVEESENRTRVEIASLSTHAKRIVAKYFFHGVDAQFGLIPFDPAIDEYGVSNDQDDDNQEQGVVKGKS